MKTPEEIKKGLECHYKVVGGCKICPYDYLGDGDCSGTLAGDALALIQQLETHAHELEDQIPKWIPVDSGEKKLHCKSYLCTCTLPNDPKHEWDWMQVLRWHASGANGYVNGPHFSNEGVEGMTVSHWMHLPEMPKEDET